MFEEIVSALAARADLQGWTLREIDRRESQLYAVRDRVEARRTATDRRYRVVVMCHHPGPDGTITSGTGEITILPGDDIAAAITRAAAMSSLVHNEVHSMPVSDEGMAVEVADPRLQRDAPGEIQALYGRLRTAVSRYPDVRMTAAEFFAEEQTTKLRNSARLDVTQTETVIHVEWVLLATSADREAETFVELTRRRIDDLAIERVVEQHVEYVCDSLAAIAPPDWSGPVVFRYDTLADFVGGSDLMGGVIQMLASGASKYRKTTSWEVGQTVLRRPGRGDPLTVYANRQTPFGTNSSSFDTEGLPAQRVLVIDRNILQTFVASQQYADYLHLAPTGAFGNVEVPAGSVPAAELLAEPYVEIAAFSWFNPDELSGEFATEIRLGYLVENGKRTPFRGGVLVGNLLDALGDARWSSETGAFGLYIGPTVVRIVELTVAGTGAAG